MGRRPGVPEGLEPESQLPCEGMVLAASQHLLGLPSSPWTTGTCDVMEPLATASSAVSEAGAGLTPLLPCQWSISSRKCLVLCAKALVC